MMKKSKIEWCDFTWNPVTGCQQDCEFCNSKTRLSNFKGDIRLHLSDNRIIKDEQNGLFVLVKPLSKNGSAVPAPTGFYPTLHLYRISQVMQKIKPANILVCHSGDLFGDWIPTEWIIKIFDTCKNAPWHNYMFLTMNPKRYFELMESGLLVQQDNFWYGTRVTQNIQAFTADGYHTFLYIDPIGRFVERYVLPPAEWMLLGSGAIIKRKWIDSIMDRKGKIPVFMINNRNLSEAWGTPLIQEFPALLYRPKEKALPHCDKCKYCFKVRQGKRGIWRACRHNKIVRQEKNSEGRHIIGRDGRTSPQWCPKRPQKNWRIR